MAANLHSALLVNFVDNNNKQTFRVNYTNNSGVPTTWDVTFTKIKSLLTANSFSQVYPSPTGITAQRCQTQNFNISFPNVQYGNPWEAPPIGYGTVTNYEYLLPIGWSLNGTTSTGSNWIVGTNNVTVTSDLSNGDNGVIRIRPINTACASGLQPGQEAIVAISRPAPILSITGNQQTICSGCEAFTINGMPSGATVQWSLSNNDAYISGCSTCSTVTVCRNSSANTFVDLIATVSHCTFSYVAGIPIVLGSPQPGTIQVNLIDQQLGRIEVEVDNAAGTGPFNWYKNGVLVNNYHSNWAKVPITRGVCDVDYGISVELENVCGTSTQSFIVVYVPCDEYYRMSPNPASSEVTISIDPAKYSKGKNATFDEVRIYDQKGNLKKCQKYNKVQQARVNLSDLINGIYFIEITNGTYKERKQLSIQK